MKFTRYLITILLAAFVALIFLGAPTAAQATEAPEEGEVSETKTMSWVLPNGGTAENVTWPQPLYVGQVPECGTSFTLQIDTYRYSTEEERAKVESYDDDGVLVYGEDWDTIVPNSWRFEVKTGAACVVVPDKPQAVTAAASSESADCELKIITTTATATVTEHVYVAESNTWVLGEPVVTENVTTRPTTAENCPVVIVPAAPVTALRVSETAFLAETGPIEDSVPWFIASLLVAIGSIGVVLAARARRITE